MSQRGPLRRVSLVTGSPSFVGAAAWQGRGRRPGLPRSARVPLSALAKARKEVDYLATVPLFSALSPKELAQVVQAAEELDVAAGEELVTEGRIGREFFLILQGTAIVRRDGREIAALGPGQWFGELSLIDNEPRSATVVAAAAMKLLVLGQAEFAGLIETLPSMAANLLRGMAHRLREADERAVTD